MLGVTWALIQPPYGVSDEPAHAVKALATAHGELRGPNSVGQFGYPSMDFQVPSAYSSIWHFTCYSGEVNQTPQCAPHFPSGHDRIAVSSTAAEYPPPYYATVGIWGWIAPGVFGLLLMRLATVIICTVFLLMSAYLFLLSGNSLRLSVLLICATPTVFAFSGVVNPFSPEVTASILFWTSGTLLLKSADSATKNLKYFVYFSAISFGLMRPASFLWIVISMFVIALASVQFKNLRTSSIQRKDVIHFFIAGGVGTLTSVVWYLFGMTVHNLGGGSPAGGELIPNMLTSFHKTPSYLRQIFGFFGWTTFYAPRIVVLLFVLSFVLLVVARRNYEIREMFAIALLIAFLFFGPAVLEGARAASSGWGFQGRYLIPVAVGIPLLLALRSESPRYKFASAIPPILIVLGHLVALNHVAKRFTVGLNGPTSWISNIKWSGVGGPIAVQISFCISVLLGVALVVNQTLKALRNQ